MLKEILKEEEDKFEDKWVVRAQGKEAFITVASEEELDSFKADMQKSYAQIIKAVCEEMVKKIKKSIDNSEKESSELECSQDGYEFGLEKAKQLIETNL